MARITIIAGPPGIGKSSSGYYFISEDTIILDPDQVANRYKTQSFADFTDDIGLCYQRAEIRHQSGLHYVSPNTILEMYNNTFSLLEKHLKIFSRIFAINVTAYEIPKVCLEFDRLTGEITVQGNSVSWMDRYLIPLLRK